MNNNVDANKKFIREQIDPSEQKEFSTYFLSLSDHQQFDSWTIQRTKDVLLLSSRQLLLSKIRRAPLTIAIKRPLSRPKCQRAIVQHS
jgi:hypothetical protein